MAEACKTQLQNQVLVEGKNDCHVLLALFKHYQLPQNFGIYECGSDDNAIRRMNALIPTTEPDQTIALILDGDNPSRYAKWQQISDKLTKAGYSLPSDFPEEGLWLNENDKPNIAIWLMPDNTQDGMLEDFCHAMIDQQTVLPFIESHIDNAKQQGFTSFKEVHKSKAIVHAYLALQDEPGMPLGQAITAKHLNPDSPIAKKLVAFLQKVFVRND